ncbi:reverse transcriptase domain-containing protein [Tanacetum coccineum]
MHNGPNLVTYKYKEGHGPYRLLTKTTAYDLHAADFNGLKLGREIKNKKNNNKANTNGEEFEPKRQNFNDDARAIIGTKSGHMSYSKQIEEFKRIKDRFEMWKKDYKHQMECLSCFDVFDHSFTSANSGFPLWLHFIPGIVLRTDNKPFKAEVKRFTANVVSLLKDFKASQGGPIILSQGHAIRANMDVKDSGHSSQLLQLKNAYRISGFSCEETKKWEQTIDNKTPLIFRRYIQVQSMPATGFPEHYFNFVAYSELEQRADVKTCILYRKSKVHRLDVHGEYNDEQVIIEGSLMKRLELEAAINGFGLIALNCRCLGNITRIFCRSLWPRFVVDKQQKSPCRMDLEKRKSRKRRIRRRSQTQSARNCPPSRDCSRGVEESYDNTRSSYGTGTKHGYHSRDRDRSRYVKRGRESESPLSSVSESGTSNGGHWKSKSKRNKSTDEDDLAVPWIWDPEDHVKIFQATAQVERWAMPTWCHMFNSTLIGAAIVWFDELPPKSIDGYKDLKEAFLAYFMQQKKYIKDPVEIYNIKHRTERPPRSSWNDSRW